MFIVPIPDIVGLEGIPPPGDEEGGVLSGLELERLNAK
jgi:hypothetical protein